MFEPGRSATDVSMIGYNESVIFRTGETVFQISLGTGRHRHHAFGMTTLGPDGTAFHGVSNGIVAVRDGSGAEN